MNLEQISLDTLEVEQFQLKDVLRCVLHTIFLGRALGPARPREVDCDAFEFPYVRVDDAHLDGVVEEALDRFSGMLGRSNDPHGRLSVGFYLPVVSKGFFSTKTEKVFWERWTIPVRVVPRIAGDSSLRSQVARQEEHETRKAALRAVLAAIVRSLDEKKAHLPPIPKPANPHNPSAVSYQFEISFQAGESRESESGGGIAGAIKRVLQQPAPSLLS